MGIMESWCFGDSDSFDRLSLSLVSYLYSAGPRTNAHMPQDLLWAIFIFVHYLNVTSQMSCFRENTWGKHLREFAMGVQA